MSSVSRVATSVVTRCRYVDGDASGPTSSTFESGVMNGAAYRSNMSQLLRCTSPPLATWPRPEQRHRPGTDREFGQSQREGNEAPYAPLGWCLWRRAVGQSPPHPSDAARRGSIGHEVRVGYDGVR